MAFLYPEDIRQTYVKRVIGLPGDRIRLENGQVIRNGRRLVEPYTQHIAAHPDPTATISRSRRSVHHAARPRHVRAPCRNGEVIVPPGMLFVLGDNRDNSADSRYWGFVPRSYVVGKPLLVYWSYDAPTAHLQEWTWITWWTWPSISSPERGGSGPYTCRGRNGPRKSEAPDEACCCWPHSAGWCREAHTC